MTPVLDYAGQPITAGTVVAAITAQLAGRSA